MVRAQLAAYTAADSVPPSKKLKTEDGAVPVEPEKPSVHACALRLLDHLLKIQDERVATGETRPYIDHELQWANWYVDVAFKGIIHLKVSGCKCRPSFQPDVIE